MQRFLLSLVGFLVMTTDAKLRGVPKNDNLRQRVQNPVLRSDIRGKTVRELGVLKGMNDADKMTEKKGFIRKTNNSRLLQATNGRSLQFFTVYDEFGPSIVNLGETAGLNGLIYDMSRYSSGQLTEDDVIGAIKGSCSVVSSNNEHFCTYEVLLAEEDGTTFGSLIASGSLEYKPSGGGYLIVEAAGDAYGEYRGGILALTYQMIGETTVLTAELSLA